MLNIHPLYSSSSGNMFHIGTEKTNILLDVGVSYKAINEGLKQIDKSLMDISAGIFLSFSMSFKYWAVFPQAYIGILFFLQRRDKPLI